MRGKIGFQKKKSRGGFTLLELIIFSAIFSLVAVTFVAILVSIVRIQAKESASAAVNRESQFLLQTIQRYVEESSMVDMDFTGAVTTTLVLRMASSSSDTCTPGDACFTGFDPARTFIYATGGVAYVREKTGGTPEPLTSSKVVVDRLEFKKRSHPDAHDSVDLVLALSFNTLNPARKFSQLIQTAVARVNAATFDSNILSATTTDFNRNLGVVGKKWKSVNGVINFSDTNNNVGIGGLVSESYRLRVTGGVNVTDGDILLEDSGDILIINSGNIGVGTSSPAAKIDIVGGGLFLRAAPSPPACTNISNQGLLWFWDGAGSDDRVRVCMKIGGSFQWATLMATSS